MAPKSILLSGASGMLGTALLEKFIALGWRVTALHRSTPLKIAHDLISPVRVDIENRSEVMQALAGINFDVFIHCAAITNLELCETDFSSALAVNVVGTKNLLDLVTDGRNRQTKVIYISSDAVYPDVPGIKSEKLSPRPSSVYGLTKLWGEDVACMAEPEVLILRTTIVGPDPGQVCSWILKRATDSGSLPLFSDVLFTPINADNLSDIIYLSIVKNLSGIYNAGSVDVISKADFGKIVLAEAGLRCPIELTSLKSLKSEVRRSFNMSLNSMRLYRDLGVAGFKVRDSIIGVLAKSRGAGN